MSDRLERLIVAEGNDINEMVKVEDGENCHQGDQNDQPFVLLLRVTQAKGKPLPIGGFTRRAMAQMLHEIAGVVPKEVVVLADQEMVMTLEEEASMMEVSRAMAQVVPLGWAAHYHRFLVARKDSITRIVRK